jgi:hypothetical protein
MGIYENIDKVVSRTMILFFVADVSGSVKVSKIDAISYAKKKRHT